MVILLVPRHTLGPYLGAIKHFATSGFFAVFQADSP